MSDIQALAQEMLTAWRSGATVIPPSTRDPGFNLTAAYQVEAAFRDLRLEAGRSTAGLKVGYANRAMWRALKMETLVWAHMYDDTLHFSHGAPASFELPYFRSPKIEPEIVFKLKAPVAVSSMDAAGALAAVEWMALGFEIIDNPYPDWNFKPADFVAAFGLHLGLVIGPPCDLDESSLSAISESLANFKVRLFSDNQLVDEGSGRNSLRNPALSLAELAGAASRAPVPNPLMPGDLVSTGTLTAGSPVARGEEWRVEVEGLPVSGLTLRLS